MKWDDRIGRRLRLKDLHTLQTVAEVGSMAKASERLALSQPAISKAVSDMEHMLGTPLLDRSSRGVALTDCGRLLVERTKVVFDEITQGVSEIERLSDPTRGIVKVGTTEPVAGVVSEIITWLAGKYPRGLPASSAVIRHRRLPVALGKEAVFQGSAPDHRKTS